MHTWVEADFARLTTVEAWRPLLAGYRRGGELRRRAAGRRAATTRGASTSRRRSRCSRPAPRPASPRGPCLRDRRRARRPDRVLAHQGGGRGTTCRARSRLDDPAARPGARAGRVRRHRDAARARRRAAGRRRSSAPRAASRSWASTMSPTRWRSACGRARRRARPGTSRIRRCMSLGESCARSGAGTDLRRGRCCVCRAGSGRLVSAAADAIGWLGWRSPARSTAMAQLTAGVIGDPAAWIAATGISAEVARRYSGVVALRACRTAGSRASICSSRWRSRRWRCSGSRPA